MNRTTVHLMAMPDDIILEILSRLHVVDIIRSRRVCQKLNRISYERSLWVEIYQRAELLLPEGPCPSQSSSELQQLVIRAMMLKLKWTSPLPALPVRVRAFPRELPTYSFAANIIMGRYFMLAEHDGLLWFDLDGDSKSWHIPILRYPCEEIIAMPGLMCHQLNAANEGSESVWISFIRARTISVLKLNLYPARRSVELIADIPSPSVVGMKLDHDFLLPLKEFSSPSNPLELFHIPTGRLFQLAMDIHEQSMADFNFINYLITSRFLVLLFSKRSETSINIYPLPSISSPATLMLSCSHRGIYPHAVSKLQAFDSSMNSDVCLPSDSSEHVISALALVHINRDPPVWTSNIGLQLFDIILYPTGEIAFETKCTLTLNVGMATSYLSFTSRQGICLAATHSGPGAVVQAHYVTYDHGSNSSMTLKILNLPDGLQSRELLDFDGYRGRMCLIHGWSFLEILDYVK